MPVTGPTRELACAALRHQDVGEPRCPATDERLMRELTEEVQRLRQLAGLEVDLDASVAALDGALEVARDLRLTLDEVTGSGVAAQLMEDGWRLVRAPGA